MEESRLAIVLVGIGCGVGMTLFLLLCIYCIRRRLVRIGVIRDTDTITLTKEQQRMYLANRNKIRMKRSAYKKKLRKELAAIPKTKNPLVYNDREVELAIPGPAAKSVVQSTS